MLKYTALETKNVKAWQSGTPDAHDQPPERAISDGRGNPCRHCLKEIPAGAEMLILAHRPFSGLHPYAESGPLFVCADPCARADPDALPDILTTSPDYLIKGYCAGERIIYGTGEVVTAGDIATRAERKFDNPEVAFLHVRSSRNNCFQLRIDREARDSM